MEPTLLVIHCLATPEGREQNVNDILRMHLGPRDMPNGTVLYKGKTYRSRSALPKETVGGLDIKRLRGRGWRVPGYREGVQINGNLIVVHPDNGDNRLDPWEITNGASGINSTAIHIFYVGGVDANDVRKAKDTRTPSQLKTLEKRVKHYIAKHPKIKVGGHNQFANKACPSFDVPEWLRSINVAEKNIYSKP